MTEIVEKEYKRWMSLRRRSSSPWVFSLLIAWLVSTPIINAATIIGTVTDSETGFGIEGAILTLDFDPTGGDPDATAVAGPFGYYRIDEVTEGTDFTLTASHPAYNNETAIELGLSDDESRQLSFELDRTNEGATILDIQVSVRAVNHGTPLADVPVHAWRFSTSDGSDPAMVRTVRTDTNGNAHFRGFEAGYFQFSVNEPSDTPLPFYESYPNPAGRTPLTELNTDHALTALLKHLPQTLNIRVLGFDPVGEVITSLENATVELTGLSPRDQSMVVPTRTSVTDEAGRVSFFDLPPIPWEAKVKLLGYDVLTEVIMPGAGGDLPAGDYDMTIQHQPRSLALTLNADGFANVDWLFENIPVTLEGIPGTNTEGIMREETAAGNFSGSFRHDERIFENLIPGRYRASLSGQSDIESFWPMPIFNGSGIIELTDDIEFEGALTTSDGIICQAAPVRIRGRVYAAEDLMHKEETFAPRYLPKAMTGIRFGEVEGNVAVNFLPEGERMVEFDTNEEGYYSIQVPPTVYGISIPTAEDYWGDHVDWKNETTGEAKNQGWPYPETWKFQFPISPPKGYATWPSSPLILESGQEYVVDIFLHKQRGVFLQQFDEGDTPTRELLLLAQGNSSSVREISLYSDLFSPDSEGTMAIPIATPTDGGEAIEGSFFKKHFIIYEDLPSGSYTFTATHPRFSFNSKEYVFPDWPAPGILPTVAPAPLGSNAGQPLHASSIPNDVLEAVYNTTTTKLSIIINNWDQQTEKYLDPVTLGFDSTSYAEIPYASNAIFDTFERPTPVGPFKFWIPFNNGFWEDEIEMEGDDITITLWAGGPNNIAANSTGPSLTFRAIPKAVYAADPSVFIPGATFEANGSSNSADGTPVSVTGNLATLGNISAPSGWIEESEEVTFGGVNGPTVTVNVTATYTKLMTAEVSLKDGVSETPIMEAAVRIRSAKGGGLNNTGLLNVALKHDEDGTFVVAEGGVLATLRAQECLVEIDAPGYKPFAKRVVPDGSKTPAELTLEASLFRLPAPSISGAELNRHGLFIPGIQLTGSESIFNEAPTEAKDPLAVSWVVHGAAANPFQVTTETIDGDPLADINGMVTRTLSDPISTLYLIDSRAFDGNPNDPETTIIPSRAPDPDSPASIRDWIRRVEDGTLKDVVYQRIDLSMPVDSVEDGGVLELPELPVGDFEPGFVAMTTRGATAFRELPDYPGNRDTFKLKGAPLPPWLSFAANALTAIAVTDANLAQAADLVPFGDYTPLGNFTAEVVLNEDQPTFLDYTYAMGTEWSFGMPTPEEGFLAFAPGVIGINATATTTFGSKGFENRMFLETVGTAENEPAELKKKRLPAFFRNIPDTTFEGQVTVNASSTINRNWDPAKPYELEVKTQLPIIDDTATGFAFELTRPLDDVTPKIPYAGPKLKLLSKLGLLNFSGTIHGFVGLSADITFRTPSPPQLPEAGTSQPVDDLRANRRHMFGGTTVSATFAPQLAFGGSITTTVASGVLEADLGVRLTGNEKAGKPFAELVVNPFSDWPWIKRVSGGINLDLAARVNLYVWEGEKTYSWQALAFDKQLGTQSFFDLTPMTITQRRISLSDSGSGTFDGSATQAFSGGSPLSHYSISRASTPILVFTAYNNDNGVIDIQAATRNGSNWDAPQTVASAESITNLTALTLLDDRTLLAWAEIPSDQLGQPFPKTEIRYVLQNGGGAWTTPALAASMEGTVVKLLPIEADGLSGLALFQSAEGPGGPLSLHALPWIESSFGPLQTEGGASNCLAFAGVGVGNRGIILCVTDTGLRTIHWDGSVFTSDPLETSFTEGPVAAAASESKQYFRALRQGGNIVIEGFNGNTAVVETGASEINMAHLPGNTTPALILTWSEGGQLYSGYFNPADGTLLSPIELITDSPQGRYSRLTLLPGENGAATLIARYRNGDTIELREFELNASGSSALNDSDGDGLNDLIELRIIDADPEDNIQTLADVLGSDDFDKDGDNNAIEITQGSDPITSSQEMVLPEYDLGIVTLLYAENGELSITITSWPGRSYKLQSSNNVTHWMDVETKEARGALLTFTVQGPPSGETFFQIVRL